MFVSCDCFVLSGRGLCGWPIPRSEEFHLLWCVTMCDLEMSEMRRPWPALGCCARERMCQICRQFSCKGMRSHYLASS
jgi:hypothetical protein